MQGVRAVSMHLLSCSSSMSICLLQGPRAASRQAEEASSAKKQAEQAQQPPTSPARGPLFGAAYLEHVADADRHKEPEPVGAVAAEVSSLKHLSHPSCGTSCWWSGAGLAAGP